MKSLSLSFEQMIAGISLLSLGLNAFLPLPSLAHSAVVLFFFFLHSFFLGRRWFGEMSSLAHPFLGGLLLIACSSTVQTLAYYAGASLGHLTDSLSLGVCVLALFLLPPPPTHDRAAIDPSADVPDVFFLRAKWIIPLFIAAEMAFCFILLHAWRARTTDAINTPWPLLPAGILLAFSLLAASAWISARRTHETKLVLLFTSSFLLAVTLLSVLLYPLGFGFDGFLHRASEHILLSSGTLMPKPPYYIGQYVFTTWLTRVFELDLFWVDILLVPLSILLIPLSFLAQRQNKSTAWQLVGLCLFLPLSLFITSTPQAFSYIIGLAAIFFALAAAQQRFPWILSIMLSVWALMIHPLSGLPFFGSVLTLVWSQQKKYFSRTIHTGALVSLIIGTSLITPLAFFLNGLISQQHIAWNVHSLLQLGFYLDLFKGWLQAPALHFSLFVDWVDFFHFLLPILSLCLAGWTLWREQEKRLLFRSFFLISLGTYAAGIFLQTSGEFSFLIDYERGNYASRLFSVATLILLPLTLEGFCLWIERILKQPPAVVFSLFLVFLAGVVAQVYQAYPRHDAGVIGHGWSVGQADIDVVRFIEKDAHGQAYTVLANQSVSAAAVSEYGFKRYAEEIFYYPIPTGGPLYQLFLEALSHPSRSILREAADLGKSTRIYLVLNAYWSHAERLAETYKGLADKSWSAHNGTSYVFRFDFSSSSNAVR